MPPLRKIPNVLVRCDPTKQEGACGLVQMAHSTPPEILYASYWYRSNISVTMRSHLNNIVETARALKPDIYNALDIGCNDGTLLSCYNQSLSKVGVDPSDIAKEIKLSNTRVINKTFPCDLHHRFDVITSIAMFYDLEDPVNFCRHIQGHLQPKGLWIFEVAYMPIMFSNTSYDTICFKKGTFMIGDQNRPIEEIQEGDRVFSTDGTPTQVIKKYENNFSGDLYNIKPRFLESFSCTPEHPIPVLRGENVRFSCGQFKPRDDWRLEKLEWSHAKDVRENDFMVMPRLKPRYSDTTMDLTRYNKIDEIGYNGDGLLSLPLDEDSAWIMGLYVAEGSNTNKTSPGLNFCVHEKETNLINRIHDFARRIGRKSKIYRTIPETKAVNVRIYCAALHRAFSEWFGSGARNKKVPDFVLYGTDKIKIAFLRGLFAGDGYVKGNQIHLHTASHALAQQTQLLTASLGATIGLTHASPPLKNSKINGRIVKSGDSWQLRGASRRLSEIFAYKYTSKSNEHTGYITTKDYILVPIHKIEKEKYCGPVFNLETKSHTYLVSNAVVHNCNEHIEYYSLSSLEFILRKAKLKIFRAELNDVNGGTIRCFATHEHNDEFDHPENAATVQALRSREFELELDTHEPYNDFNRRVVHHRIELQDLIHSLKAAGKRIHLYGASTKGNTIIQYCGFDNTVIDYAAERSVEKYGAKTLGTNIPIISEEESRAMKPDYYLVMPWHFRKEIVEREKDTIASGIKFIFPLPRVEIVG